MRVLVTGGAGYIGSHSVLALLQAGHNVTVLDNFSNSSKVALERVAELGSSTITIVEADIRDEGALETVFLEMVPDAVLHFAGLKSVADSMTDPLNYYDQNVGGSVSLLSAMSRHGCNTIVFSSSATVYGDAKYIPIDELHPLAPVNPYGQSKLMVEEILKSWVDCDINRSAVILRYFNPVGADSSGKIGEDPSGVPANLVPYITQVAAGRRGPLKVFGSDYETRDGTGERDYIHVSDLADAHVSALDFGLSHTGSEIINVGTGRGTTVLELLKEFNEIVGDTIEFELVERRPGDTPISLADVSKASKIMNWKAKYTIADMCTSAMNWQTRNPNGYK